MRAIRRFTVRPVLPVELSALEELAGNLRWSWHPPAQDVFRAADPEIWEQVNHDPVRLLGSLTRSRLEELVADQAFLSRLDAEREDLRRYLAEDRWYQRRAGEDAPVSVAYFSPEFGITDCLNIFAGGLGLLAGDHLKSASDVGVPLVGVGLMYQEGYFRQTLNDGGWQQEFIR